jgi:UDP-N-acetylmuramyl pentapeptide phosphotransferase/UDP-N-acetylglucosamine-1-phosphate transferase
MDNPDTHRKLHREPIAICGGIAILFSLLGTSKVWRTRSFDRKSLQNPQATVETDLLLSFR